MIKFEEVATQTTEEYFNGNQFSIDAFKNKYAIQPEETYVQAIKRVCDYVASVEDTKAARNYWSDRWFDEIYNDWWQPAGSIMQGAGSGKKISLANCSTVSLGTINGDEEWDTLESIIRNAAFTVAKMAAYRQGLGIDFSRLRPIGVNVLNSANKSSGAIHWMQFIDSIGQYVGQQGRIPAFLISLSCSHPDIEDFIKAKSDHNKIQNANISVQCSNKFYRAIENDAEWKLIFEIPGVKKGQKVYIDVHSKVMDAEFDKEKNKWYYIARRDRPKERIEKVVKAKELMMEIAKNMFEHGEPGVQNIDVARKYSNSDYVYDPNDEYDSRIVSSNACCLDGDVKVLTNKGHMSMKEIHEAKDESLLAMSYDIENEIYELKPIINTWQQRNDSTVELTIEEDGKNYHIKCSGDHPILTKNRGYVEAASLSKNDNIVILK